MKPESAMAKPTVTSSSACTLLPPSRNAPATSGASKVAFIHSFALCSSLSFPLLIFDWYLSLIGSPHRMAKPRGRIAIEQPVFGKRNPIDVSGPLGGDPSFGDVTRHRLRLTLRRIAIAAAAARDGQQPLAVMDRDLGAGIQTLPRPVALDAELIRLPPAPPPRTPRAALTVPSLT